ncbi:MAG: hypothetical protein ACK595_08915, partial [Planctomycetota bacterium]
MRLPAGDGRPLLGARESAEAAPLVLQSRPRELKAAVALTTATFAGLAAALAQAVPLAELDAQMAT